MKKSLLSLVLLMSLFASVKAQVVVVNSKVPKYTQGLNGTNNKRMPFVFWGEISGLTPSVFYRYYTALDSFGGTLNGAGNPYFVNQISGVVKRSNNASLSSIAGYDSLLTDASGNYAGWFMVESSGNARFTPGKFVYPLIVTNNGTPGGTTTTNRIRFTNDTITVLDFSTSAGSNVGCSAVWDSTAEASKSFVFLYDNVAATGRPLSGAIVESDGLSLQAVNQISPTYKANADSIDQFWCTIMPNQNVNGVKALEYRDFNGGLVLSTMTDADAIWCSTVNTNNPAFGQAGMFLNSFYAPIGETMIADTVGTNVNVIFASVNTNGVNFTWDFGDASANGTGQNTVHQYTAGGWFYVTLTISGSNCSFTVNDSVFVDPTLGIKNTNTISEIKLYPIPVKNNLIIEISAKNKYSIYVYDLTGRTVETKLHVLNNSSINLENLNAGNYFVKIIDEEKGTVITKKIIKD